MSLGEILLREPGRVLALLLVADSGGEDVVAHQGAEAQSMPRPPQDPQCLGQLGAGVEAAAGDAVVDLEHDIDRQPARRVLRELVQVAEQLQPVDVDPQLVPTLVAGRPRPQVVAELTDRRRIAHQEVGSRRHPLQRLGEVAKVMDHDPRPVELREHVLEQLR